MGNHKHVRVKLYDGNVLPEIDKPLVKLVQLLNRPGLWTTYCCQGDKTFYPDAYISVSGPLARHLIHRLLDDQLDHPMRLGRCITFFESVPGEPIFIIRWHARDLKSVTAGFKRVLSEKTFNMKYDQ